MYPVVNTGQTAFYNASVEINQPSVGQPFHGQDAHYTGNTPGDTTAGDLHWSFRPTLPHLDELKMKWYAGL